MKKSLTVSAAMLAAVSLMQAQSDIRSAEYFGVYASSISDNGEWMVCETDNENSIKVINLITGESWSNTYNGNSSSPDYSIAFTRAVSDDGTVVGEVGGIPSYRPAGGDWTSLKGWKADNTGYVYAVVGAITPDGSMIVGSLGKGGASLTQGNDDVQATFPCVWYRQDDGTYGDPVWLPNPDRDIFDRIPQYVNCIAVSTDGHTIGAMMRSGSGYFHFPIAYTLNADGNWDMALEGMNLVNPDDFTPYPFPGEFESDIPMPNYEEFMTPSQLAEFTAFFNSIIPELTEEGFSDEDMTILEHAYAMDFMEGTDRTAYERLFAQWFEPYEKWMEDWARYEASMEDIIMTGYDFEFNNIFLSPDGKYIYSSAKPQTSDQYVPARIEIGTDNYTLYPNNRNILITGIASDYSILGHTFNQDGDFVTSAYIFPQGDTKAVELSAYLEDRVSSETYTWMEDHMYQSVATSLNSSGSEIYTDEWVMGKPVCTPDMGLIAFASSTFYWETRPTSDNYITFLVNTGLDVTPGTPGTPGAVEALEPGTDSKTEFYTLQGVRVTNPGRGIFIKIDNGKASKVIL